MRKEVSGFLSLKIRNKMSYRPNGRQNKSSEYEDSENYWTKEFDTDKRIHNMAQSVFVDVYIGYKNWFVI